jgi:hypothetical protein
MDNLVPLIDADILRYEVGFAAETGWKAITEDKDALPPFSYVANMLEQRIEYIQDEIGTKETPILYLTEGRTFRYDLAVTKPYKGTRKGDKPYHYDNLSIYMKGVLDAKVVTHIEADDALAIDHLAAGGSTIICSRDKDLRQVPGWFYSWELGRQPAFGPVEIRKEGSLELHQPGNKLRGTGLPFFCSQVLTGDAVDNIPGLPGCGPVRAHLLLEESQWPMDVIDYEYKGKEDLLLEQGRLCWIVRRLHDDGTPVLWEIGMED